MDVAAILAAHRKTALERIAASKGTVGLSAEDLSHPPTASTPKVDHPSESSLDTRPRLRAPHASPITTRFQQDTNHTAPKVDSNQNSQHTRHDADVPTPEISPYLALKPTPKSESAPITSYNATSTAVPNVRPALHSSQAPRNIPSNITKGNHASFQEGSMAMKSAVVRQNPFSATPRDDSSPLQNASLPSKPLARVALQSIGVNVSEPSRVVPQKLIDANDGEAFADSRKDVLLSNVGVGEPTKEPNREHDNRTEPDTCLITNKISNKEIIIISDDSESPDESDEELNKMLGYVLLDDDTQKAGNVLHKSRAQLDEYKTAPLFSQAVVSYLESQTTVKKPNSNVFTQYGLLGVYEATGTEQERIDTTYIKPRISKERLIFTNMDAPWSTFICGSQGAGKSHTLSCLLENALLSKPEFNKLPNPLSGLVFHYDKFTGKSSTQLCEAAYLCSAGVPVTVLVSPSNIWNMKEMYTNLPSLAANSRRPKVLPLYLSEKKLTTTTMMKLMCADAKGTQAPLYISVVHSILQEMAMQGYGKSAFSYPDFKRRLDAQTWIRGQAGPLQMRLKLLELFLEPSELTRTSRPAPANEDIWAFKPGSLTIVDLSDPFVDENDACALFSICLTIFMESRGESGQIIALDEAHKFLTQSGEAKVLTEDLTSIIRQQRHTGTRVIIATQEPTLSPKLMDLANMTIVHRFLSPDWYETIKKHLAGANKWDGTKYNTLFEIIVALETGEALLFCPTALIVQKTVRGRDVNRLGNDFARIRIRKRQTTDGGRSIMASGLTTNRPANIVVNVPMFRVTRPPSPPRQRHQQGYGGNQRHNSYRGGRRY